MTLPPDIDHANALAARTFDRMREFAVPPTPRNFEIWHAHVSSGDPELTAALEAVFADGGAWSDKASVDLHGRFFGIPDSAPILAAGASLSSEIDTILKTVDQAGQQTASYGKALDVVAGQMNRGLDAAMLQAVVHQLTAATRSMRARTEALQSQLNQSSTEVAALREAVETIRHEAQTDALTGLANRKHFEERLAFAAREAAETHEEMCVVIGDVDHFKTFNDTWGHQTGDQVLRLVAQCFTENVKGRDTAARYGGEEFVLVLPSTSLANARLLAEHIRKVVQTKKVVKRSSGETLGSITISLGIASLRSGEDPQETVRRADACLYTAKRSGRNLVVTEDQVDTSQVLRASTAA
ncbi:MAG: GGDEF domain-containing protein [Micropepsaceae bacterium]